MLQLELESISIFYTPKATAAPQATLHLYMYLVYLILLSLMPNVDGLSTATAEPELPYPCFFNEHDRWLLHGYRDNVIDSTNSKPVAYQKFFEVIIQFDYDEHIQAGSFEGQSLSNLVYGKYDLLENNEIKVTQFGHSQMQEPSWGVDNLELAMNNLNSFSCSGDTLFLNYNKGAHSLIFLKTEVEFYDWDLYFKGSDVVKELTKQ